MVVGLFGNKSPDSNRFTPVTPKSENDVRLQVTLGNQNPTGLSVGAVSVSRNYEETEIVVIIWQNDGDEGKKYIYEVDVNAEIVASYATDNIEEIKMLVKPWQET